MPIIRAEIIIGTALHTAQWRGAMSVIDIACGAAPMASDGRIELAADCD
jgi:hypothetical protein